MGGLFRCSELAEGPHQGGSFHALSAGRTHREADLEALQRLCGRRNYLRSGAGLDQDGSREAWAIPAAAEIQVDRAQSEVWRLGSQGSNQWLGGVTARCELRHRFWWLRT